MLNVLSCLPCLPSAKLTPEAASASPPKPQPVELRKPERAVQVILGHISPIRLCIELPLKYDRSWTGAQIWPSGLSLADWLARREDNDLVGKQILELGCGSAPLASAVAALRGARQVVATDGDETAVQMAYENLKQCALISEDAWHRLDVKKLLWDQASESMTRGAFEIVIFADGVYTEEAATALAYCIDYCLASTDEAAVYGVVPETRVGASQFIKEMTRRGFVACELDLKESASAVTTSVEGFVGCTRDEALQKGPCRLVTWRRSLMTLPGGVDDAARVQRFFDERLAVAEFEADQRIRASGFVPGE
eukprot:TRINITY_DN9276_c2_g1_i1.p1 TRINITY_DN9276_c2_g1~~TRINITY_DN9276_c2_g1_i1.p1  ORF type:complete len:309 (-),score=75.68 TRINITY_DN9276_c2_g1_i1:104-1030(-)